MTMCPAHGEGCTLHIPKPGESRMETILRAAHPPTRHPKGMECEYCPPEEAKVLPRIVWDGEDVRVVEVAPQPGHYPGEVQDGRHTYRVERSSAEDALGAKVWEPAEKVTPVQLVKALLGAGVAA